MITQLHNKLDELNAFYSNDEQLCQLFNNYIMVELPNYLMNAKKNSLEKEERQSAHNNFVKQFINNNKYFYNSTSEIFFCYDNDHYTIIKEDTIIYNIVLKLRNNTNLMPWKFKIKTSILKQIKEISILDSLPESNTIQNIQSILSNIFESKEESKYFLTIIGDIILKKPTNINIISSNAKPILRTIENIGSQYFGHISIMNSFKFKYHDHNYSECRILVIKNKEYDSDIIFKNLIDLVIVSCYYSNRFTSADAYLDRISDIDIVNRILFLKNNKKETIVDYFITTNIQDSTHSVISMKNMLYLWKLYLEEIKMPYIIPQTTLKQLLKTKVTFNDEKDGFIDCTSTKIPFVSKFLNFWDETMKEDSNEYYLEIDEICILFKNYSNISYKNTDINDLSLLNIIKHFYPDVIIDGTYISGISCTLWNKQQDIVSFLNKKTYTKTNDTFISLYELYNDYLIACKKNMILISKNYFDMFIKNHLSSQQSPLAQESQLTQESSLTQHTDLNIDMIPILVLTTIVSLNT
jgi:hypothetical protein